VSPLRWIRFITDPPPTPKGVAKPERSHTTGVYYDTEWAHTPTARFVRRVGVWGLMKPAIAIYGSPKVVGVDRLNHIKGPVLFAANHHSHADTSLLLATIPAHLRRKLVIAAGADYFFPNRLIAAASALFIGAIPIERQRLSKLSVANAVRSVEKGRNLLIFPEGGRSPDGWGRPHRPGAAFVSHRTGAPVIPVYIDGTGRVLPKGRNWPSRSACAVVFGRPMRIDDGEDVRAFASRIQSQIAVLADEFAQGWWEARKGAHRGSTADLAGPRVGAWRRRWALGPKPGERRRPANEKRWPQL
jgi:1-acyl-sn-glycerol-3-phosphate acyltransferase